MTNDIWQQIFVESLQTSLVWLPPRIKTFSYARSVQQQQLLWKENSWVQIPQCDIPPAVIIIKTSDSFFINYDLSTIKGLPDNNVFKTVLSKNVAYGVGKIKQTLSMLIYFKPMSSKHKFTCNLSQVLHQHLLMMFP